MVVSALYDWLVFGHIVAAMVWLGGGTVLAALAISTLRAGDAQAVARFADVHQSRAALKAQAAVERHDHAESRRQPTHVDGARAVGSLSSSVHDARTGRSVRRPARAPSVDLSHARRRAGEGLKGECHLDETRGAIAVGQLRVTRLRTDPDVLRLYGELDLATIDVLLTAARGASQTSAGGLRMDASGVSFVDCAGLGSLVELAARTRASGGRFEISAASRPLIRLSELTGVGDLLRIASGAVAQAPI